MTEVERLIRLTLTVGPWHGREVREVVARAADCGNTTIKSAARRMVLRGELIQGAWALAEKSPDGKYRGNDSAAWRLAVAGSIFGPYQRPAASLESVQGELAHDELLALMGDDKEEMQAGWRPWF